LSTDPDDYIVDPDDTLKAGLGWLQHGKFHLISCHLVQPEFGLDSVAGHPQMLIGIMMQPCHEVTLVVGCFLSVEPQGADIACF
jgi:hypothetical protein